MKGSLRMLLAIKITLDSYSDQKTKAPDINHVFLTHTFLSYSIHFFGLLTFVNVLSLIHVICTKITLLGKKK